MNVKRNTDDLKEKTNNETAKSTNDKILREPLRSGGELVICGGDVRIEYFFRGPDRRYGGSKIAVHGKDIPDYIKAFRDNWDAYEDVKKNSGKQLVNVAGSKGMLIKNGVMGGVYLKPGQMRISTEEQLAGVISDYEYCYTRYMEVHGDS